MGVEETVHLIYKGTKYAYSDEKKRGKTLGNDRMREGTMGRIGAWFHDGHESEKDRVCGGDRNDKRSPNKRWEETKGRNTESSEQDVLPE